MENRRTKLLPKIILGQAAVALLITTIALSILFYAEGYRLNVKSWKIAKTGIVYLVSYPKNSSVYINGVLQSEKTPMAKNLVSGNYNVEVKNDKYVTWSNNIKIESQLVKKFENIVLIKDDIEIESLSDSRKISTLYAPSEILASNNNGLFYNQYEIWLKNNLVARFFAPIQRAILYPDKEHVVYQQGSAIRIIDDSGRNDTLLIEIDQESPIRFALSNKGEELYFQVDDEYYFAKIR